MKQGFSDYSTVSRCWTLKKYKKEDADVIRSNTLYYICIQNKENDYGDSNESINLFSA